MKVALQLTSAGEADQQNRMNESRYAASLMDGSIRARSSVASFDVSLDDDDVDKDEVLGGVEDQEPGDEGRKATSKTRRILVGLGALLALGVAGAGTAVHCGLRKDPTNGMRQDPSPAQPDRALKARAPSLPVINSPPCVAGLNGQVQEPNQVELGIIFESLNSGNDKILNKTEALALEEAVRAGFNKVTGFGCNDTEFGRWMYAATLVHQELTGLLEPEDIVTDSVLHTVFEIGISCSGCYEENAFATVYPTTFEVYDAALGPEGRHRFLYHDHVEHYAEEMQPPSLSKIRGVGGGHNRGLVEGDWVLSAGVIMNEISKSIHEAMSTSLGRVAQATVKTRSDGMYAFQSMQMTGSGRGGKGSGKGSRKVCEPIGNCFNLQTL